MDLKGKVAIVTGASSGYGVGTAEALKNQGCTVWITSNQPKELKEVADRLKVKHFVQDIMVPKDWDGLVSTVIGQDKKIDILVNNAGGGVAIKPLIEQTDEEIKLSIDLNLTGHIYGTKRVAKEMVKQKSGNIISISSVCAQHAWPDWSVYSAAKAGIEQFGRGIHNELRLSNIHVTTLMPSWGATKFVESSTLSEWRDEETIKKIMNPEEMGDLIVFICKLPGHLVMPFVRVQPMVQEINPM
jgi:NADP-dependent 3-hydroxy acid dehydrogenase YdfG